MTAAKKLSYSLEPEVLRKYWSRILLDSTRILELPAFIHMHGDIVAQLIKLDEFEANEDRLWERLVEWSRKAVRDAEILGPFADATGETVKRSKSEDDSSGLGAHELAQQEAILSAMSKDIRFGAMNKEFFFHKARAFLSREKSDEIMEYFLLGNKPEQLQVAKRAGLVPKHNLTVETIHEITCATDDPTSPRENSQLAALARGDTGLWCPTWSAVRQLDVLDVLMGREVCIGEIVLTWEESRAIPRLIILETYADGKWHSMDCEISVSSDNGCRTTTHTPAVLSLATCMKFRLIFLPCRVEVASVRQIAVLCKQTIQQCANQVAENMLRADLSQLFVRSLADATPGAGGTLGRCLQRRRLQHGELSDRVTGAMTACVCVEGDSIAELQDHMNTTGHSEHRNPEQMARTTEPLGVPYKDALKADKLGREADFLAVAEGEVEHADVMAAFLQWDQNGDGVIDKDELLSVFTDLGLQIGEKELKSMFASADISHDKTIDYSEFLQWIFKSAHWQIRNQFLQTGVSWHGIHKGRNAVIQEDRLTVKRQRSSQERAEFPHGHAIVVSTGCAREFRFLLVDNDGVYKGGFEAGFSSMPPDELPDPLPECAKELSCAYVSSPTGHLVVLGEESEVPPWKHHLVASGTVVELKCKEGSFQVLLDGKIVANWPLAVPDEMDLYPLVSVYGTTCAIKLLPAEGTPSTGSKAEARTVQVDGGFQYFFYQNTFEEESKSMGWGMFFAYFACGAGTVSFLYYFYKAKYSFHQTEILIVDAFRFVVTDLEEPKGVSRDDVRRPSTARSPAAWAIGLFSWRKTPSTQEVPQLVLELISELGYSEKADFLYRGEGHIEDWGALLESLTLLCALRADAETKLAKPQEPKEGEDPMPQPKSDAEALEILKRKFRRAASVLNSQGAEQLRAWQATAGRRVGGAEGGNGLPAEGRKVKEWLLEAGLQIDLDGLGAKVIGRSPFLVVSAERSALELEAERLGYIKPHRALRPHVKDQDYGKIEFEGQPDEWVKGYIGYEEHDFWLPCERVQLLRHRIEEVPAPKEQMKQLKVRHSTALAVSDRLLPALKIAGLVDCMVPMDDDINDDLGKERRSMWKEAIWMALTPVDRIQRYFGSEVALYFAWLNHFTLWLVAPAAVGLLFYLRMHFFGFTVDDDPFLPFYSLFVVFWGMCFLRSWDRHCAVQAWHWNVHGVENRPEHRAEFVGELRTSRVTGQLHRYYPEGKRFLAYALSVLVTSLMLAISFCVMICSLNLQGFMEESVTSLEQIFYIAPLARLADHGAIFDPNQKEYFGLLAFGPIVLHVFAIMNLNKLYRSVAEWLTEQENHELLEHHQSSLMAKRFMFEAFDCYIVLFYVGFVQQDIRKLRQELLCLYGVDSLRRVFVESILPLVLELISKRQLSRKAAELKRPERDMSRVSVYDLGVTFF
ncbi:unnamed protein product [Durusdinium trenchii]|uniref:EF-hand domain-containing protein n=1 Tax=Durusdinium trenchii TaxID=1381693 RepID=A0ABP0L3G7_9DINO